MAAVKISVCGRECEYDPADELMMAEVVALEDVTGLPWTMFRANLATGRAKALAGWAWLILRRNGIDEDYQGMCDGTTPFSIVEFTTAIARIGAETAAEPDPTQAGAPSDPASSLPADPDGTATTPPGTNPSSRRSTASGRGKSGSSPRTSSTGS